MAGAEDCIFCKIISGAIPAIGVMATEDAFAFLDIAPLAEGHTLLVPKRHYGRLTDVPGDELGRLTWHLAPLARAVQGATGTDACNILQNNGRAAGQEVQHVHFHIIPRKPGDGLGYRWNAGSYAAGRAEQLQSAICDALRVL